MNLRRFVMLLTAALGPALVRPAAAQLAPSAFGERSGRQALADIPVIETLLTFDFTVEQATQIVPLLTELAEKQQALADTAAQAEQASAGDLLAVRDMVLNGVEVPASRAQRVAAFETALSAAQHEREEAVMSTVAKVLAFLNAEQRARLAQGDTGAGPGSPMDAETRAKERRELYAFQQQVCDQMMKLLDQARGVTNNQQFRAQAPQAALEAALRATGMLPEDRLVQQYAQYLLNAMTQCRTMQLVEYMRRQQDLAIDMTQAAVYVVRGTKAAQEAADANRLPITSRDVERLVRYPRTGVLLSMLSQLRVPKAPRK